MTVLGPLPEEWEIAPLKAVVKNTKRTVDPRSHPDEEFDYYSIPSYQAGGRPLVQRGGEIRSLKVLIENGTVLFGKLNPRVPKVWLVHTSSTRRKIASTEFIPLVPESRWLDSTFLYYLGWTSFLMDRAQDLVGGSTPSRQRVDVKAFMDLHIPIPPLREQQAIGRVLRAVQEAKEATKRVIAALRELKNSLARHLFTYGPVPVGIADRVPLKETGIGPAPNHWGVVRLGEIAERPQYGLTASAAHSTTGPKFLRITDIQGGRVSWSTVPHFETRRMNWHRYQLHHGDLLIARIGATTGKTFIVSDCPTSVFASYLIRVSVDRRRLNPAFLFHFAQGPRYWSQIDSAKGGRLKQGVNIPILSSLRILLPPRSEQRIIVDILDKVDGQIAAEEVREASLGVLFKSLLYHLVTGQLRVRSPERTVAEDPA